MDKYKINPNLKEYNKIYDRNRQLEQRKKIREYKKGIKIWGCFICGYKRCQDAIEFHHIKEKKYELHSQRGTINMAKREIEKCVPVCANCHREIHNNVIPIKMVNVKYLKFIDKLRETEFIKLPLFSLPYRNI